MGKLSRLFWAPILALSFFIVSCDSATDSDEPGNNTLYVKFTNSASSTYTITVIKHMDMGKAGETVPSPSGVWSDNILDTNKLVPGASTFFTLPIPNLHYSECRYGVLDSSNNEIMLHEQPGYVSTISPSTITHWGSDERTVSVTIQKSVFTDLIDVMGWSDWAGID
jgi:hypothetical protein